MTAAVRTVSRRKAATRRNGNSARRSPPGTPTVKPWPHSAAGAAIGEDGPSQMALEDFAALRAVHSSAVVHPSDANQVPPLVEQMADRAGISYMRTLRGKTTVRTRPEEDIRIGGSRLVRSSEG